MNRTVPRQYPVDRIQRMQQAQEELDPFGTGKLPSGRHGLSREVVVRSQRERMVESMIAVVAMKGYTETTVADIISNAGVSRTASSLLTAP